MGGAIGALFGPEAIPVGAYLGGRVGAYAGQMAGEYIASHMSNANEKAEAKLKKRAISRTCSTCKNCNDLQNEIDKARDTVTKRQQELREDQWNLYKYRPGPRPGYEDKGTWPGHQQQYRNAQQRLRNLLDDAATADCKVDEGDSRKQGASDTPSQPAPKPENYVEPDPRGINAQS